MADRQGVMAGTTGANARTFYNDGSNWLEVQGLGSMEITPPSASSNTYSGFEGSFSVPGEREIGAVTYEVASFAPNHRSWKHLRSLYDGNDDVTLRTESRKIDIAVPSSGAMVAISAAGAVTFSGGFGIADMPGLARGHVLVVGSKNYTVEAISDADTPVVTVYDNADGEAPGSNVAAARLTAVVQPILRWIISGAITTFPSGSLARDSAVTSQLVIQPRTEVAVPAIALAHSA